ncbi:uncharacterized protein LOC124491472 [Dermatophagoides farinae]|uniref:uncharacterized protein LOC124491472 n=1 Tax=Dermatophagoides farinae TaxID=6954 RepID=UPI003F618FD7
MCDYYSHIDNIVKHQFFIRFPSILIDLYQILLNNPQKLFLIENFFENFYKHSQMLLQRYSRLVSIDSIICDDNEDEILKFMDNVEGFMSTITKSYTYEQNDYFGDIGIKQCALQLSFIVDHFVFTIGNGDIIRGRIRRFISLILFSLSTLKCDDYETVSDMIIEFMKNLNQKFLVTCTEFQIQNDFSILHDLYAISNDDIVLPLLQFIEHHHDNDNNLAIYMKKMSTWNADEQYDDLVRFAQINSLMITIANGLFYFGNDDDDHHRQQLLIILIRQLFKNIYLLEKFIIISKRWNLLPLAKLNVIESIIDEYKSHLPTLLKEDESSIMMAIFQSIDQQQQQQPEFATLPFIAYLLEKYPSTNMSLANICEMNSNWKNCQHQQQQQQQQWIQLIETNNHETIDQSLHRIIEPNINVEMIGDNETTIVQRLSNVADLSPETVYELLFTINMALYKLPTMQMIKSNIMNTMKLLSESDFCNSHWFKTFPNINDNRMQYQINYLTANLLETFTKQLITDSSFGMEEFTMCISIYKQWCQLIFAIPDDQMQLDTAILCSKIFRSLTTFIRLAQKWINNHRGNDEEQNYSNIIESIRNFLAYHCLNMLLPLFVIMSDMLDQKKQKQSSLFIELIHSLSSVLLCIDDECLQDMAMLELNQSLLMYNEDSVVEQRMKCLMDQLSSSSSSTNRMNCLHTDNGYYDYIIEHVTPLLLKNDYHTIFTAYHLVSIACHSANWSCKNGKNSPSTSTMDAEITEITLSQLKSFDKNDGHDRDNGGEINPVCYPPKFLMALLESLFASISIDDLQSQATFAYLLVWTIYLRLLQRFPYKDHGENEIRSDLINYLVELNLHNQFLQNLFLLMHDSIDWDLDRNYLQSIIHSITDQQTNLIDMDCLKDSNRLLQLIGSISDTNQNARLAVFVYYQSLCHMANVVRCWFNTLRHHQKETVDYVTRRYFSQLLMEKELEQIKNVDYEKLGNIQIKFSRKLHEISAIYSLKEISFGIRFIFEANYPLTALSIQCFDKSGVSEDVCRKWLQRLTIFFNRMNCSILDGIIMIKPTMDKLFEGMEECMICLYVLYGMNGQLPRFKCPQCKKKFHTTCMRKWFQTHHSATCPQCKFEFQ